MIIKDRKEVVDIHVKGRTATLLFRGKRLVWEAVKSCFGRGMWINEKPWSNEDGWRNTR